MNNDIEKVQKISLNILKKVIKVCEELGIPYYVVEGSCLGAVRHQGFIPWDDDIDIAIPGKYYEKFLREGQLLLGDDFLIRGAFQQELYPDDTDIMTKVFDKRIKVSMKVFGEEKIENPWVDVFLLFGLPDSKIVRNIHFARILLHKMFLKMSNRASIGFNSTKKRGVIERIILGFVKRVDVAVFFNELKQSQKIKDLLFKYSLDETKYLVAYTSDYRWKEIMPKEVYGKGVRTRFEDIEVYIPEKYDEYLARLYGDYMQLPPEEKRVGKHNIVIIKENE